MSMNRVKVLAAKLTLYAALLELPPDDLKEGDLRMMECLCKDIDIRDYFRSELGRNRGS